MPEATSRVAKTSDAFIRHVGHDLRSSLNAVVAWGELVRTAQLPPEELTRAGDTIVRQARHLSRRLSDVLDLWRVDVGALTLATAPASVAAALRSASESARSQFEARRVECRLVIEADGAATVDTLRLAQAFTLLLMDSALNTGTGECVEVTLAAEGDGLVVSISGGGRPPSERAFDCDRTDTSPDGARPFDFGLPLARTLITLNGCTLDTQTATGGRVTFVVRVAATPHAVAGPPVSQLPQAAHN